MSDRVKIGRASKLIGMSSRGLRNYVNNEHIQPLLSEHANGFPDENGEPTAELEFTPEDIEILRTVYVLKSKRVSWEDVADMIEQGHGEEVPDISKLMDNVTFGDQLQAMVTYRRELDMAHAALEEAESRLEDLQAKSDKDDQTIRELEREVGEWRGKAEVFRELYQASQSE